MAIKNFYLVSGETVRRITAHEAAKLSSESGSIVYAESEGEALVFADHWPLSQQVRPRKFTVKDGRKTIYLEALGL